MLWCLEVKLSMYYFKKDKLKCLDYLKKIKKLVI